MSRADDAQVFPDSAGFMGSTLCAALALWLVTHPLVSVYQHDARVYSILALHRLDPLAYAKDPFFQFGSQDSFSIFSFLYAPLVHYLGLTVAAAIVIVAGGVFWCMAAMMLARRLMPPGFWWVFAALTLAISSVNYSPNREVFWLNEHFATARSIAFPIGMVALALCLGQRYRLGWLCAILSLLLHPLIGIWPVAVLFLWRLRWRQALGLALSGLLLLIGLAIWGPGPFAHFDPEWERILRETTLDLFVAPPDEMRWHGHLLQLVAPLLAAAISEDKRLMHFYAIVAIVSASGLLVAAAVSYWWPAQLLVQAQLWRGMWLAAAILPLALVSVAASLHVRIERHMGRDAYWISAGMLIAAYILTDMLVFVLTVLLVALLYVRIFQRSWNWPETSGLWIADHRFGMRLGVAVVGLLVLPSFIRDLDLLEGSVPLAFSLGNPALAGLIWIGGLGAGTLLWALALWQARGVRWLPLLLVCVLVTVASRWDMRPTSIRAWEARAAFGRQGPLADLIRPGQVVLWEGSMPFNAWFELRTAHYASEYQSVGMVFSRAKMAELLHRTNLIRSAAASEYGGPIPDTQASHGFFGFSIPHGTGIPLVCRDRALDWIILQAGTDYLPPPAIKGTLVPPTGGAKGTFAIPCAQFRAIGDRQG